MQPRTYTLIDTCACNGKHIFTVGRIISKFMGYLFYFLILNTFEKKVKKKEKNSINNNDENKFNKIEKL